MPKVFVVLASRNFSDTEFIEIKNILAREHVDLQIISDDNIAEGANEIIDVDKQLADLAIDEIADVDGVVFLGGVGIHSNYREIRFISLARVCYDQEKIVAAIGDAVPILANAGILDGKKVTCTPAEKAFVIAQGADYIDKPIVVDGTIITARESKFAREFGEEILQLLKK